MQLDDLTRKLMRIGLDNIYGYVPSTAEWVKAGGRRHERMGTRGQSGGVIKRAQYVIP